MEKFAYINSRFVKFKEAKIHIEDRGLQFADSVYEVIAVINKNLIDLNFHLRRLKYSLGELKIKSAKSLKNKKWNKFFIWHTLWHISIPLFTYLWVSN